MTPLLRKRTLAFAALAEFGVGLLLLLDPSLVAQLLLGSPTTGLASVLGRCFGTALVALGIACWPQASALPPGGSPRWAMAVYNVLVALYLGYLARPRSRTVRCYGPRSRCMQGSPPSCCGRVGGRRTGTAPASAPTIPDHSSSVAGSPCASATAALPSSPSLSPASPRVAARSPRALRPLRLDKRLLGMARAELDARSPGRRQGVVAQRGAGRSDIALQRGHRERVESFDKPFSSSSVKGSMGWSDVFVHSRG
jgi:hypothetical protein